MNRLPHADPSSHDSPPALSGNPPRGGVGGAAATPIDDLMDRACLALAYTDYFEAEELALRALSRAHAARDYERMSRICLPLQEARRMKWQSAADAGACEIIDSSAGRRGVKGPGVFLFQPPLIAAEAREFQQGADRRRVFAFTLTREPMVRSGERIGRWPIVAVGHGLNGRDLSIRTYVEPPPGVTPNEQSITRDLLATPPSVEWMLSAGEALGDAAIAKLNPSDPASHRVDDLIEFLDAWPSHEKLHQRLAEECRIASREPAPTFERRRGVIENPWSF